jgi:RNA polymerase sigma-70 factor (ECF subfamily)
MPAGLRGRVLAEDLLQETLLVAARRLDSFEGRGPASFYRWLVGIARFKVAEAQRGVRAGKRACETPLRGEVAMVQTSVSGRAARQERSVVLNEALDRLPGRQGDAVRRRYLEGRSLAETARLLACSEPAVKALVSRGLAELARALDDPPSPDRAG